MFIESVVGARRGLLVVVGGLVALAWLNRFIQDDAFITFRYARHLAEGHGLVWNPGESPVAGYTTFLWAVLMSGLIRAGIDPVSGSWAVGLSLFAGTLLLVYRLARDLGLGPRDGRRVVVLLGTNYTFSAWATGGMETQLQAFLVVLVTWLTCGMADWRRERLPWSLAGLSVLHALLLMTRLDSGVVVAVLGAGALVSLWRLTRSAPGRRVLAVLALVGPGGALVGTWLAWAQGFYGEVLPNTYHVKLGTSTSIFGGLHYVYRFLVQYWLLPLGLLLLVATRTSGLRAFLRPGDERVVMLLIILVAWGGYVVRAGGDFMEFRFLVAVLPLLYVWAWRGVSCLVPSVTVRRAVVIVLMAGSALHAVTFRGSLFGIESIDGIAVHMREEGGSWDQLGQSLGRHFGGPDSDVSLAVGGAGAVPYYSGLRSLDMRGLNDRWVARHGLVIGNTPGHQRMAPFRYLVERGVTLVVGHPQMSLRDEPIPEFLTVDALRRFGLVDVVEDEVPPAGRFLVLPVGERLRVLLFYLSPHPRVEAAIADGTATVVPLRRL